MSLELVDATAARQRVHALHALDVLDTPREQRYDRIVRLAQRMFDVPMVAVNLIDADRQWTKAEAGLDGLENTPSSDSMCRHTVERPGALIVTDTTADDRFATTSSSAGTRTCGSTPASRWRRRVVSGSARCACSTRDPAP